MEMVSYRDGEAIVREGDDADGMYFILKGGVSVFKDIDAPPGEDTILSEEFGTLINEVGEGKVFGELAFLAAFKSKRSASIVAGVKTTTADVLHHYDNAMCICLKVPPQSFDMHQAAQEIVQEKMEYLEKCILFAHWDMQKKQLLAYSMSHTEINKGEAVMRTGRRRRMTIAVISGKLKVVKVIGDAGAMGMVASGSNLDEGDSSSIKTEIAILGKHEIWGLQDLVPGGIEDCILVAETAVEYYCIPRETMMSVIAGDQRTKSMIMNLAQSRKAWETLQTQRAVDGRPFDLETALAGCSYAMTPENCMSSEQFVEYCEHRRRCDSKLRAARQHFRQGSEQLVKANFNAAACQFQKAMSTCLNIRRSVGGNLDPAIDQELQRAVRATDLASNWTRKAHRLKKRLAAIGAPQPLGHRTRPGASSRGRKTSRIASASVSSVPEPSPRTDDAQDPLKHACPGAPRAPLPQATVRTPHVNTKDGGATRHPEAALPSTEQGGEQAQPSTGAAARSSESTCGDDDMQQPLLVKRLTRQESRRARTTDELIDETLGFFGKKRSLLQTLGVPLEHPRDEPEAYALDGLKFDDVNDRRERRVCRTEGPGGVGQSQKPVVLAEKSPLPPTLDQARRRSMQSPRSRVPVFVRG